MARRKSGKANWALRSIYIVVVVLFVVACSLLLLLIKTKELAFEEATDETQAVTANSTEVIEVFPIGVDPLNKQITENPSVLPYFEKHFSYNRQKKERTGWLAYVTARLSRFDWYQNLASPLSRILVIEPGERKEQVIDNFGDILKWNTEEREIFEALVVSALPSLSDGKFFPGHYVVSKDAEPEEIADILVNQFSTNVVSRYPEDVEELVPLEDALTIASLLEREAYSFEDMRHIAGIIWNRLFAEMHLQIDASLQYAKTDPSSWWPKVTPNDKFIESEFNTYKHEGLPPSPIANPSVEAILAALNPKETDCMFYFHDSQGGFHCSVTYEEHVALLKEYYGKGQ